MLSAHFFLPDDVTLEQKERLIDSVIGELGLGKTRNTIIGDEKTRGVSGGERKRAAIAVQLIADPAVLFLDEPTSGLDSFAAYNLIKLLTRISSNCAILCTIHQPSSDVFALFDKVIFVKDGRIFYGGANEEMVDYYARLGYECPENYNPADYIMTLCQSMSMEELDAHHLFMSSPDDWLPQLQLQLSIKHFAGLSSSLSPSLSQNNDFRFRCEASRFQQIYILTKRNFLDLFRDYPALIGRFVVTTILGILCGLIFLQIGDVDNSDLDDFNSHVGALSMINILFMFGTAQSVLLTFPSERAMILREYITGTCKFTYLFDLSFPQVVCVVLCVLCSFK